MVKFLKPMVRNSVFIIFDLINIIKFICFFKTKELIVIYRLPWMRSYKGMMHIRYLKKIVRKNHASRVLKIIVLDIRSPAFLFILRRRNRCKNLPSCLNQRINILENYYKRSKYDLALRSGDIDTKFLSKIEKYGLNSFMLETDFWQEIDHYGREDGIVYVFPDIAYHEGWIFKIQNCLNKKVILIDRLDSEYALLTNWDPNLEVKPLPNFPITETLKAEAHNILTKRVMGDFNSLAYMSENRRKIPNHFKSISFQECIDRRNHEKEIVIFFLHCFTDAVNIIDSELNSKNFYCHLKALKKMIANFKGNNFDILIKIHPNWFIYENDIFFMESLNNSLSKNTNFLNDENLSVGDLTKELGSNFVAITGRGTVTLELAYNGVVPYNYIENTFTKIGIAKYLNPTKNTVKLLSMKKPQNFNKQAVKFTIFQKFREQSNLRKYGKRYL